VRNPRPHRIAPPDEWGGRSVPCDVSVALAWSTHFDRPSLLGLWGGLARLRAAYRAPAFFGSAMREAGSTVGAIWADEEFGPAELDALVRGDELDILYVSTHGKWTPSGYMAHLRCSGLLAR
jgi:hypothetical protein